MATKTKRITSQSIRENAKRDHSPKWEGADKWTSEQFNLHFRNAMDYYRLNHNVKDLRSKVIEWMGSNGYSKEEVKSYKKTKDSRTSITMCSIAACLLRGMPAKHAGFRDGKDTSEYLREQIQSVINEGSSDIDESDVDPEKETETVTVNVQDRIREQAGQMSEEIDYAIDKFINNPAEFDPNEYKIVSLLRGKGAKAAQARYIKGFFTRSYNDLVELASGKADEQLREAYSHLPRKHVRKLIEFYVSIHSACDQIIAEAKVLKKVKPAKVTPVADMVKKVKFRVTDDKLAITSIPPAQIIAAQGLVVYNVKTRKMGYYIAGSTDGFTIKGTTIQNFTDKSVQKTLRKPLESLKEFKEQNTQRRFETWFDKQVKTTDTQLNGRLSEDVILLKVFR